MGRFRASFDCFTDTVFGYLKTSTEFFTFHPDVWCHGNPDSRFKLAGFFLMPDVYLGGRKCGYFRRFISI